MSAGMPTGGGSKGSPAGSPSTSGGGVAGAPAGSGQPGPPGGGAMTPEEQRDVLDGRLRVALGRFDDMMLEQQGALEEKRRQDPVQGREDPGQAQGAGQGVGVPGQQSGSQQGPQGGQSPGSSQGQGGGPEDGDDPTGGGMPGDPSAGDQRVPPDVGDGRDDDVVARQLREAAMKEEDPELRERLWDEYREYKKSAGS